MAASRNGRASELRKVLLGLLLLVSCWGGVVTDEVTRKRVGAYANDPSVVFNFTERPGLFSVLEVLTVMFSLQSVAKRFKCMQTSSHPLTHFFR